MRGARAQRGRAPWLLPVVLSVGCAFLFLVVVVRKKQQQRTRRGGEDGRAGPGGPGEWVVVVVGGIYHSL